MTRITPALFCLWLAPLSAIAAEKPNIVLIMVDDLGFADLGCYGSEIETPNLDALANDGLRFTQFYNTAKCHSSRVSLLTGLYCDQAGGAQLSRGATIAEVLSEAGYFTAMVGKWHLKKQPTDFGFQRFWGHLSGATNYFTGDGTFRLNGKPWEIPERLHGRPFYTTCAVTDFALETELKDLSQQKPERVAAMAAEWFRVAEHVDRLDRGKLAPVRDEITSLSFRKNTSSGSASKRKDQSR